MRRLSFFVFAIVVGVAASACSPEKEPAKPSVGMQNAPAEGTASPVTGVAREGAEGIAATVAKTAEESGGSDAAEEERSAEATPTDLSEAAEPGFSLEKLTELAKSLPVDQLEVLATKLSEAIQSQLKVIEDLKSKVAGLSAADLLNDTAAKLKASVEKAASSLGPLREKLGVVAEMLKEQGVDISKYTSLLEGK